MKKSKRILILVKNIEGGTGTFALRLQKIKNYSKYSLQLKTLVIEEPRYLKVKNNGFKKMPITFFRKKDYTQKYTFTFKRVWIFLKEIFWINNQINNYRPDLIISIDVHSNLLVGISKFISTQKFKSIFTTNIDVLRTINDKSSPVVAFLTKKLISFIYKRSDMTIAISRELAKNFKKDFSLKDVACIYHGVDYKPFTNRKYPEGDKIVISVSRFDPQKDHSSLIKAFAYAQQEIPNLKLWLVGDGVLKKSLITQVRNLNLSSKVKFFGWVDNVIPLLKKADVFVLSSRREGLGQVLLEALSQGMPIISTNSPYGPSEVLESGKFGMLVPVGDVEQLRRKLLIMLKMKKVFLHFSNQAIIRNKFFSLDKMQRKYAMLIDRYLANM